MTSGAMEFCFILICLSITMHMTDTGVGSGMPNGLNARWK